MSVMCAMIGACVSSCVGSLSAKGEPEQEERATKDDPLVDHLALAAIMVRDGHDDRAMGLMAKVDPNKKGVDLKLYYTLQGLLRLKQSQWAQAQSSFESAIAHGQHDDMMFVYLAQCDYGLKRWERVLLSVRNAKKTGDVISGLHLMKAHALIELKRHKEAWDTLVRGAMLFPKEIEFVRQQTFLLISLGLHQEAAKLGSKYLTRSNTSVVAKDYVALATAFMRSQEPLRAKVFLEIARARFPQDLDVSLHLAQAYIKTGHFRTAGDLLQRVAGDALPLIKESAEAFKRAQAFERALYMNTQIIDQKEKFKQRVSILLERQAFEELSNLGDRVLRLGLDEDQNILYALAYATFKTGDFERAEPLLKHITEPKLFEYATQLRRLLAICKNHPGQCL